MKHSFQIILLLLVVPIFLVSPAFPDDGGGEIIAPEETEPPTVLPAETPVPDPKSAAKRAHHERLRKMMEEQKREKAQQPPPPNVDPSIPKLDQPITLTEEMRNFDHLAEKLTELTGLRTVVFATLAAKPIPSQPGEYQLRELLEKSARESEAIWKVIDKKYLWFAPRTARHPPLDKRPIDPGYYRVTFEAHNTPLDQLLRQLTMQSFSKDIIFDLDNPKAAAVPVTLRMENIPFVEFTNILQLRYELAANIGLVGEMLVYFSIYGSGSGQAWEAMYPENAPKPPVITPKEEK